MLSPGSPASPFLYCQPGGGHYQQQDGDQHEGVAPVPVAKDPAREGEWAASGRLCQAHPWHACHSPQAVSFSVTDGPLSLGAEPMIEGPGEGLDFRPGLAPLPPL